MSKALQIIAAATFALAAGLLLPQPAGAHHSFALFDVRRTVELEGTVKTFEWTNPHSWIRLTVAGPQNSADEWLIELPAAANLVREGWNKNFVRPGERLIVRINPLKDGRKGGSLASFSSEEKPDAQ
jgi:hypothetical protein